MSKKEKLIKRLLSRPKDFTFDELEALLGYLDYKLDKKGKTSGSRVAFFKANGKTIILHKPHPGNILNRNYLSDIIKHLKEEGDLK
ncbi:MAG: type II toxin-antitoxin system HicA family toxin [Lachnospiraceae bacterium]|nr:type II toxin-antitoxin system HicA family toxin [Lachnospiraceae bacterium]